MKQIKWVFISILILGTMLFWFSLNEIERTLSPWALRKSVLYYTGVMSFLAMTIGVILAMRLQSIERWVGGLDKHYRLHKWLGMTAALFAVAHWLSNKYKLLIEFGVFSREDFAAPVSATGFFDHQNVFKPLEGFAKDLGEWALYALLLLAVLALWKKFPYRYFFKTHRILAVIYLMLAFHSLALFGKIDWISPAGILLGILLALGIPAALISIFKQVGATHRASGQISKITLHEDGKITEVQVSLTTPWQGHKEGQFAFVTFDHKEGHHPFTLSSSWNHDGKLTFHIKQLGDYTRTLSHTLKIGDQVTVEGPYGRFDFSAQSGAQIWIAGGIGITPFLSRLETLARSSTTDKKPITLFYSARPSDHALIERVQQLVQKAGVVLHLSISGKNPALTAETIHAAVPDLQHQSVWFCGATTFGRQIKRGLLKEGLPSRSFNQELFEMR
jgi:predicted ferric reductase